MSDNDLAVPSQGGRAQAADVVEAALLVGQTLGVELSLTADAEALGWVCTAFAA